MTKPLNCNEVKVGIALKRGFCTIPDISYWAKMHPNTVRSILTSWVELQHSERRL